MENKSLLLESQQIDKEAVAEKNALFQQYVIPYCNMIYKLCIKYSFKPQNVEDNYTQVLTNLFKYIKTYDPNRSILTWLHICTKRYVFVLEKKRRKGSILSNYDAARDARSDEISYDGYSTVETEDFRELYNDDILSVLEELPTARRDALLLQMAGYTLKEIVEIEHERGNLKSKNIETIKSRLFLARQYLKKHLTRDGERIRC